MRKLLMVFLILPSLFFASFFYPYMGGLRGFDGDFSSSVNFTLNSFIGFGYTMSFEAGYSDFLGKMAFHVSIDALKSGRSLYRFENGSIVEYRFPYGPGWAFSGSIGVGTGENVIYGANLSLEKTEDTFRFSIFPAVGFKMPSSIIAAFAGLDSDLTLYAGLNYLTNTTDSYLFGSFGNEVFLNFLLKSHLFDLSIKYSPDMGDLFADARLKIFGISLGGHVEITDRLDYYVLAGVSVGFGRKNPENWYINEVLKKYSQKNYEEAYKLVNEGIKLYPNSSKLAKYRKIVEREYLSSKMLLALSSGNVPEARRIAMELMKKYKFDVVALKRCVNLSEKTILNPAAYSYTGLEGDDLKKFSDAVFHYLTGDYTYAINALSKLLVKHRDNDYIKVKLAEVFAAQGAWKNALKMLERVSEKVVGYSYAHALAKEKKGEASAEDFLIVFDEGDIDHIRDSLFGVLKVSVEKNDLEKAERFGKILASIGFGKYSFEGPYYLGLALLKLRKYQQAVDYLAEAVGAYESMPKSEITPQKTEIYRDAIVKAISAYENLARTRLEYYLSAADYVAKLISITTDPKERFELVKKKAIYLYKGHDYENALYEFEDLMSKDKSFEKYYNASKARELFARLMRRVIQQSFPVSLLKDDFEKVTSSYEKVLQEDPSILDRDDYINLAYSALITGNYDIAQKALNNLKGDPKAIVLRAYMEFLRKNIDDSEKLLKNVKLENVGDFYEAMYYKLMGRISYIKKNYERAVKYLGVFFDKYMGMGMDSDDILAVSDSYIKLNKPEKVLEIVSEEKLGSSPGLYLIRAQALMKVGQYEEAFKTLEDLAESPMLNQLSDELKAQAFKMMGTLAFEIGNYWKAKDYFEKAFGFAARKAEDVKDKFELSDILIRKASGEEVKKSEFEKLIRSKDEDVRVISSVELADLYLMEGNVEKALEILKDLGELKDEKLRSFVDYEIAKCMVYKKDYSKAVDKFLAVWKFSKDRKVLRKAFALAAVSEDPIALNEVHKISKDFLNDPVLSDMARYVSYLKDGKISEFLKPDSFLAVSFLYMLVGRFSDIEGVFKEYYDAQDPYGKIFVYHLLEKAGFEKFEKPRLEDRDDPIAEHVRSNALGTIKSFESYDLEMRQNDEIEWKYEHKASRYYLYEISNGKLEKLQSGRRRKYKIDLENGFHVMVIKAKKSIGAGAYIEDLSPPFVVKVTDNFSPKVEWIYPSDGKKTYLKMVLSWEAKDPDGDEVFYNVYYGKDLKRLKKLTTAEERLRFSLEKGEYYWFVEAIDENENIGFSPVSKLVVTDIIQLTRNWVVQTGGSFNRRISQVGSDILVSGNGGELVLVDKAGKVISNIKVDVYLPTDLLGTPDGRVIYKTYSGVVCMDSKGKTIWKDNASLRSNIAVDEDGNVYYAVEGKLIARDRNGNLLWQFPPAEFFKVDMDRVAATDRWIVALSSTNGRWVIWIDKKGNMMWQSKVGQAEMFRNLVVDNDGNVFVSLGYNIVALKNGRILWQRSLSQMVYKGMVEMGDRLYVAIGGNLMAFSKKDGTEIWRIRYSQSFNTSSDVMVIGENNEIYILSEGGERIYVINEFGRITSTYYLKKGLGADMIMGSDGVLYVVTANGYLVSLTGASFSSPSGWNQFMASPYRSSYVKLGGE